MKFEADTVCPCPACGEEIPVKDLDTKGIEIRIGDKKLSLRMSKGQVTISAQAKMGGVTFKPLFELTV